MRKINLVIVLIFCILFCDCKDGSKQSIIRETVEEKEDSKKEDSEQEPERIFEPDQPSRVITYKEIIEYLKYMNSDKNSKNEFFLKLSDDFSNMLKSELRMLRNEFYARKGYIFKSTELNEYFLKKSWYNPRYTSIDSLTLRKEEQQIVDSILVYENKNAMLTDKILKNKMTQLLKETRERNRTFGYYEVYDMDTISVALFRRNIGYLLTDTNNFAEFEEIMYGYPPLSHLLIVIDTIGVKKDILLMAFVKQFSCPNEYCLYKGALFTCDTNFDSIIDSKSIVYDSDIRTMRKESTIICYLKMPEEFYENFPLLIDSEGKITDYEE